MKKILILILLLISNNVYAAAPTRSFTYISNTTIDPAQVNTNENSLYSYLQTGVDTYANGSITGAAISASASIPYASLSLSNSIVNSDISSSAAIDGSKLGLLSTVAVISGKLPSANGGVPVGGIIMWSGTLASIPTGFVICDGTNGTPDLRKSMIVSTANATNPGTVSGSDYVPAHTHAQVAHQHQINANLTTGGRTFAETVAGGVGLTSALTVVDGATTTGSYGTAVIYALAFIMKT